MVWKRPCSAVLYPLIVCGLFSWSSVCVSIQESELIDRGDDEGIDDSAHSPVPEDKPKIQVSQHFHCVLQNYWSEPSCCCDYQKTISSLCLLFSLIIRLINLCLCLQNVIPQQLLDQYLSMTDPARAQTVDTEIAKHCAFSLPGVALTLGRQNWHCLKDTYETLATDVQVRKEAENNKGFFSSVKLNNLVIYLYLYNLVSCCPNLLQPSLTYDM